MLQLNLSTPRQWHHGDSTFNAVTDEVKWSETLQDHYYHQIIWTWSIGFLCEFCDKAWWPGNYAKKRIGNVTFLD